MISLVMIIYLSAVYKNGIKKTKIEAFAPKNKYTEQKNYEGVQSRQKLRLLWKVERMQLKGKLGSAALEKQQHE
jgi:hypothetical protein